MIAPTRFVAKLDEPALSIDPTSKQKNEQLPAYNAYSPDGNVTAPLVYMNYGVVEDYEELALHGVSVKGAIVIAGYGHSWRGIAQCSRFSRILVIFPKEVQAHLARSREQCSCRIRKGTKRAQC